MNSPLTEKIIGCAFALHKELGAGFLEKIYENVFKIVLEESGLVVEQQHPIPVRFRGCVVGEYFADLLVNKRVVIEIKAVSAIVKEHEMQLVNYLTATGIEDGLLINFGDSVQVKHKFKTYRQSVFSQSSNPVNPEKIL